MGFVKVVRDGYDSITNSGTGWSLKPVILLDQGSALRNKLMEEVAEYLEDRNIEELVDVYEVVIALAHIEHDVTLLELSALADEKRERKGGLARVLGLYLDPK